MPNPTRPLWLALLLALQPLLATATGTPTPLPVKQPTVANAAANADHQRLQGVWVRPDGGYIIHVKEVGRNGQLVAIYYNPNPLPFARAEALSEGGRLRAVFELRAGGYDGSTYELSYDAANDRLTGTYYQAVVKQRFDVVFERQK